MAAHRLPVSHKYFEERMECSRATITRAIDALRDYFNVPLIYDRQRNGYYYDYETADGAFELPGVWFDANELYPLLTARQLLEQIEPGLLGTQLKPVKDQLEKILAAQHPGKPGAPPFCALQPSAPAGSPTSNGTRGNKGNSCPMAAMNCTSPTPAKPS